MVIEKSAELKTAERDLVVYKGGALRFNGKGKPTGVSTFFMGFNFNFNTVYKAAIEEVEDFSFFDAREVFDHIHLENKKYIGPGFHSAMSIKRIEKHFTSVFQFVIPKGSLYYQNLSNLCVSNQIMLPYNDYNKELVGNIMNNISGVLKKIVTCA
jgi:hypothetical protein